MSKINSCCWHCGQPLARAPGGKPYFENFVSPSGVVRVHKCCFKSAVQTLQTPHIFPVTEVRSETYEREEE